MKLYYKDNSLPKELPFRIRLSDGNTRTDPSSFTDEEIADAGYIEAPAKPRIVEAGKSIVWNFETHEWDIVGETLTQKGTVSPSNGWNSARLVRDHLQESHSDQLCQLSDAQLEQNDLYVCRECEGRLFVSLTALNNHVRCNHYETRTLNNLELVEQLLFKDLQGTCDSHWPDALDFLRDLQVKPPPFRQPLTSKIRHRLEQSICNTFVTTIQVSNEALKPHTKHGFCNKKDFDRWTVAQLPVLFEQLVLFPITKETKKAPHSLNQVIHSRLRKFKQGKIRELYEESQQVVSKTP